MSSWPFFADKVLFNERFLGFILSNVLHLAMEEDKLALTIFLCAVNSFSSYTAIMLNCVTIHTMRRTPSLPQTLKILLLNLAVSDLGVGLVVQPCYVACGVVSVLEYTENDLLYKATYYVYDFSSTIFAGASFFCVVALSLDRFLAIYCCLRYKHLTTRKRVVGIVIAIWLVSTILSLTSSWSPWYTVLLMIAIMDVVCEITSTFFNLMIYRTARAHMNQLQSLALAISHPASNASSDGEMANVARVRKFAKLSIYLYLTFVVCYLPQTCMMWIIGLAGKQSTTLQFQVMKLTETLVYLNSSINPLIYCLTLRSLRVTIKNMIQTLTCCRSQPQPPWFELLAGEVSCSHCNEDVAMRVSSQKMKFSIITEK